MSNLLEWALALAIDVVLAVAFVVIWVKAWEK